MNTVEGAIVALLKADALTNSFVGGRIHPATDPQNIALPKLTYQRLRTQGDTDNGGFTNQGPSGYETAAFQIECWSLSMLTAKEAIRAARICLNGYSGTVGGITIACIRKTDERELTAAIYAGQTKPIQRYMLEVNASFGDT